MSSDLTFLTNEPGKSLRELYELYGLTPEEIKIVEGTAK